MTTPHDQQRDSAPRLNDRAHLLSLAYAAASALNDALRDLRTAHADEMEVLPALARLRDVREQIGELVALDSELLAYEHDLHATAERQFLELESAIRTACAARAWCVDGQWPKLFIERGIAVEIDETKRAVSVAGQRVASPSAASVIAAVEPLVKELIPRAFSPPAFVAALAAAYDEVRDGPGQVPIFEVYRALVLRSQKPRFWRDVRRESFVAVSADQFRARLTRALEAGPPDAPDGRALKLIPPLNPSDGLFVYLPAEDRFGYIGRVAFEPRATEDK